MRSPTRTCSIRTARTTWSLAFGMVSLVFPVIAQGQGWRNEITNPGTFGVLLEPVFASSLQNCGALELDQTKWVKRLFTDNHRSNIPIEIQRALKDQDLLRKAYEVPGSATLKLWRYTFDKDTQSLRKLDGANARRLLDENAFGPLALPIPETQDNHVAQLQSCSSVIAGAANVGLNPPAASMSAALKSDYTKKQTFAFVRGTFVSPLARLLDPGSPARDRRLGLLTIYQLYQSDPGASTRQRYYLAQFEGGSLIDLGSVDQKRDIDLKSSAAGNFIFASADGSLKYGSIFTAKTTAADYKTYVFNEALPAHVCDAQQGCVRFEKLPTVVELNGRLAAVAIPIDASPAPTFSRAAVVPIRLSQEIGGIPRGLCGPGMWRVEGGQPAATVVLGDQRAIPDRLEDCHFDFLITPAAGAGTGLLPVPFDLVLDGVAANAPHLKLSVTLTPTDDPRLQVLDFTKVATAEPNPVPGGPPLGHSWAVKMTFFDAASPVNFAQPMQASNFALSCDATANSVSADQVMVDQASRTFTIKFVRPMSATEEVKEGNHFRACTLASDLAVPLSAGGNATRRLITQVLLPVIGPKSVPGQAPN